MIAQQHSQLSEELIALLSPRGEQRSYERGQLLFEEGEHSDALYILIAGELKVFTSGDNGRELVYNLLKPGEFFGELTLDGGPRSASVRAMCASTCLVLAAEEFRESMRSCPELVDCLTLKLIARVRHATEQLRDMAMKDVYQRATALLNELAVVDGDVRAIDKAITQQEIANRVGATREMVNHIIRDLVRGGFLVRQRGRGLVLAKELPKNW